MNGPVTTFWSKLLSEADGETIRDADGAPVAWHPLVDHCADVAAVFRTLLDRSIVRRRLASLAAMPDLDPVLCDRLAFFAALHDIGKVNMGFWNRCLPKPPFAAGHLAPLMSLFSGAPDAARIGAALSLAPLVSWVADEALIPELLLVTFSHHGQPLRSGGLIDPRHWRASRGLDPAAGAADLRGRAAEWFPTAFEAGPAIPAEPRFHHALNGLLTLADWIASDAAAFPFSRRLDSDRFAWARERAETVIRRLGLAPAEARASLGPLPPSFASISDHEPRDLQSRVLDLPVDPAGSIAVLEAETGAGKTEAALVRFLRLFHAGLVDGLYFALPTRTAATQIHGRVVQAVRKAFSERRDRPAVILAVPGYLTADERLGTRVSRYEVHWDEADCDPYGRPEVRLDLPHADWNDDDRPNRFWRGWAAEHSKRYLAGSVVVGTIDQALLAALAVPHSHMRATALLRHLLVVDEVHASDAYMTRILETVLERHCAAGGHALLMSATLGAAARERLLVPGSPPSVPSAAAAAAVPYPVLIHSGASGERTLTPLARQRERVVHIELHPVTNDPTGIAARVLDAARAGARVLVVRNTVTDCIALQETLEAVARETGLGGLLFKARGRVAPHHGRFSGDDRKILDRSLEERFGREAPADACAVVATQTVEQSLDIDADLLFTDICPMDVLLQRLGRVHRHERERPAGFGEARAAVLVPASRDLGRWIRPERGSRRPLGLGSVYDDLRIIEATWRLLEEHPEIRVPEMCRKLVERATHPEHLTRLVNELGGDWQAHRLTVMGTESAARRIGSLNLACWDKPFSDPDVLFPSGRSERQVRTRLGEDDRLADFDPAPSGPFGEPLHRLTIPAHLAIGVPNDARVEEVDASDGSVSFRLANQRFRYDRLGLRRSGTQPKEDDLDD